MLCRRDRSRLREVGTVKLGNGSHPEGFAISLRWFLMPLVNCQPINVCILFTYSNDIFFSSVLRCWIRSSNSKSKSFAMIPAITPKRGFCHGEERLCRLERGDTLRSQTGVPVMKLDEEQFKRQYATMPDEAFADIKREELVDVARRCYDEEVERRSNLQPTGQNEEAAQVVTRDRAPMMGHVRFIAFVFLIFGVVYLFGAGALLFHIANTPTDRLGPLGLVIFVGAVGAVLLASFWGLIRFRSWGRNLVRIWSFITIFNPFSWYVLWVMSRTETGELFGEEGLAGEASGLRIT